MVHSQLCQIFLKLGHTELLSVADDSFLFSFLNRCSVCLLYFVAGGRCYLVSCSERKARLWDGLPFVGGPPGGAIILVQPWNWALPMVASELRCFLPFSSFNLSLSTLIRCPGALIFWFIYFNVMKCKNQAQPCPLTMTLGFSSW